MENTEKIDDLITKHGINYQDSDGDSLLHTFTKKGNIQMIGYLLDRKRKEKIDINLKNNTGRTALFYALNEETVEFLLIHKIDYAIRDNEGKKAEDINDNVNFIINNKCSDFFKKRLFGQW